MKKGVINISSPWNGEGLMLRAVQYLNERAYDERAFDLGCEASGAQGAGPRKRRGNIKSEWFYSPSQKAAKNYSTP